METALSFYGMGWVLSYDFGEPVLNHAGLVENYASNMFIFPESGIGIAVLVNMNDYFVDNNLTGNMIMPLLGEAQQEVSGNPYIRYHILLDSAYLLIMAIAALPIFLMGRWRRKRRTIKRLATDILTHGLLPIILLILPCLLGVPLWVVWYFVKDLFLVLTASAVLLLGTGAYKLLLTLNQRRGKSRRSPA